MSKTKLMFTLLIGIIFVSIDYSFADNVNNLNDCLTDANTTEILATFLDILLRLMGWFWIPFATIAGKLMMNSMIYGEFLNLDKTLYMLRNISRTFANFAIAAIIIWSIIQGLINKDLDTKEITKKILKLGVGLIIANMSWFLIGATIDVSTILTSAVGALPGTYFNSDQTSKLKIIESSQVNESQRRMTLDTTSKLCDLNKILTQEAKPQTGIDQESEAELLDKILPQNDSISGPLLYIGSSVLKIQNLMYTNNTSSDISDHLMIIFIRFGIVIVFFIAIIMILVINMFRIVYLWFFIAFAPILAILKLNGNEGDGESIIDKVLPKFSIGNIIKLIFAPAVMTGLLGILLIIIVLMQQVLQSNNSYVHRGDSITMRQGTVVQTNSSSVSVSTLSSPGVFETTLQGNIISNQVSNVFSDLLMLGITIVLFWGFIKAIIKYNEDGIGGETIKSIGNLAGSLISNAPILNIGGAKIGLGTARDKAFGNNSIIKDIGRKLGDKQREQEEDVENIVRSALGQRTLLSQKDYKPLVDYANRIGSAKYEISNKEEDEFFNTYESIRGSLENYYNNREAGAVSLSGMSGINESFPILLKAMSKSSRYRDKSMYGLKDREEGKTTIESYITDNYSNNPRSKEFFNNLYKKLGGDPSKLKLGDSTPIGNQFWSKKFHRQQDKTGAPEKEE